MPCAGYTQSPAQPVYPQSQSSICHKTLSQSRHTAFCTILSSIDPPFQSGETLVGDNSLGSIGMGKTKTVQKQNKRMRQQGWFQTFNSRRGERKRESKPEQRTNEILPPTAPPKSSLTQQDDSSMFKGSCCIKPAISDVCFPPLSHFMLSECSSYNLDCFFVLTTYPEVTCDREVTWNRGGISEREASEGPTPQGEVEEAAVCNLPICLCGRTGSGPKVLGHDIPWAACDQTSVGNPAGGSSEA